VFVDTNVLIFASLKSSASYETARSRLAPYESSADKPWISRQVQREYLASITRARGSFIGMPMTLAVEAVRRMESAYRIAEDNADVTSLLLELLAKYPVSGPRIHDVNIVATMLAYGIDRLLTDNVADFEPFRSIVEVMPLHA
jgi:predicted nucleic acid-binding protein